MRCRRIQPHVLTFVEGELSPRKQRQVAAHLTTCLACAALADELRHTLHLVQSMPIPEPSALSWERFAVTLRQRLQHEKTTAPTRRRFHVRDLLGVPRPVFVAAAVCLLLLGTLPVLRSQYQQRRTATVGYVRGEAASLGADLDLVQYLDLLEEVDTLEQLDIAL